MSIGSNSGIGAYSIISSPVSIGNDVMMARECIINPPNHCMSRTDISMNKQGFEFEKLVVIDDDVG